MSTPITKSLILPVYKNEENIPQLLLALEDIAQRQGEGFEAVFVIDGSPDNSHALLQKALPQARFSSQIISLSRNFGSFVAIRTGMEHAKGSFLAVMAADLQEPPELINLFFVALENDSADIIFGQRVGRKDRVLQKFLANVYWGFYRKAIIPDIPKGGVDIFACNAKVKEAVLEIEEPNSSLIAQLFWVGHRRLFIPYERQERTHGKSAWGISKRLRYMLDSVFSYTDFPILTILWMGVIGVFLSLFLGFFTLIAKLMGFIDVPGYTTLILVGTFVSSAILTTQGIIGCYIWRALENSKKRPLSIVMSSEHFEESTKNN